MKISLELKISIKMRQINKNYSPALELLIHQVTQKNLLLEIHVREIKIEEASGIK